MNNLPSGGDDLNDEVLTVCDTPMHTFMEA